MLSANAPLLAAAISAITNQSVLTYDDYIVKYDEQTSRRADPNFTPRYLFKGSLNLESLHQGHLVGGPVHTEIMDDDTIPTNLDSQAPSLNIDTSQAAITYNNGPTGNTDPAEPHLVYVKTLTGQVCCVYPRLTDTVRRVKELVQLTQNVPVDQQRLILQGKQLNDDSCLADYSIMEESTLHLVLRHRANSSGNGPQTFSFINFEHIDPGYDFDFTYVVDDQIFMRGNFVYRRPCGWLRMALNVLNRYDDQDNAWLGVHTRNFRTTSSANEWPVTYHGTGKYNNRSIAEEGYEATRGTNFAFGRGIYTTPDIDLAAKYAEKFEHEGVRYKVVIQSRVNPENLIINTDDETGGRGEFWISQNEADIRPYSICVRKDTWSLQDQDEE